MLRKSGLQDRIQICMSYDPISVSLEPYSRAISGGGNTENLKSDGFGPPLRWILYEAMDFGLRVKPFKGAKWKPSEHHPSLVGVWKLLEYYPFRRLSYNTADEKDNEDCCRWYVPPA